MKSLRLSVLVAACAMVVTGCKCSDTSKPDGGGMGGGSAGGAAGGSAGGSAGGAAGGGDAGGMGGGMEEDGGRDAGPVDAGPVDPFDDGGTFVPGDICSKAVAIDFAGASTSEDGGVVAAFVADLSTAQGQYATGCESNTANDLIYQLDLAVPQAVSVVAAASDGGYAFANLAIISEPCVAGQQIACSSGVDRPTNVLSEARLESGRYYVLVDSANASSNLKFDVSVTLTDPAPAATNDSCMTAEPIVFTNDEANFVADTSGARNDGPTADGGTLCSKQGRNARDVVYTFSLTQAQDVTIQTSGVDGSQLEPVLYLRANCNSALPGDELACGSGGGTGLVRHSLEPGTYYLWIDGDGFSNGPVNVNVQLTSPTVPPMGDTCATVNQLMPNQATQLDITNSNRDRVLSCDLNSGGGDVFYSFTLTDASKVTITASSMSDDVVLGLLDSPCESGQELACRNALGPTLEERLVRPNLQPGTYFVVLQTSTPATSTATVLLTVDPPVMPPMNDTCSMPEVLVPGMSQTVSFDGASADATLACVTAGGGADRYYQFTTTMPQKVTITATVTDEDDDVAVALIGGTCVSGTALGCADEYDYDADEDVVVKNLPAGTYFVVVQSVNDPAIGSFGLSLSLDAPVLPPTNDTCATATVLQPNMSISVDLPAATHDVDLSCGDPAEQGPDVYYTFTITTPQIARVTTTPDSFFDYTFAAIFSGPCGTGTELLCNDFGPVSGTLQPGTYYVVVQSYYTDVEDLVGVELTLSTPPANDTCMMPAVVTFTNNTFTTTVDTSLAGNDYVGSCGSSSGTGGDYVYQVEVPPMSTVTVTAAPATGSDADPVLYARSPTCTMTADTACSDAPSASATETITLTNTTATAVTYFVIVDDYDPSTGGPIDVTMTRSP